MKNKWDNLVCASLISFATSSLGSTPYTVDQVAQHKDEISCWIIIDKKVYDVTSYLDKHPKKGRQELIESCGKDATLGWNLKGDKRKPHSKKATAALKKYEIGKLNDATPTGT